MAYVYKHIRRDNKEPFYIGVGGLTSFDYYARAKANSANGFKSRTENWYLYVSLYGFDVQIVLDNCTEQEAYNKEEELISLYGRIDLGTGILVNMTNGGKGSKGYSDETKRRCGVKNIGKKVSEETRKKISLFCKKRGPMSQETKNKISLSHKNKKKTTEQLLKLKEISPFKSGFTPWNKGKTYKLKKNE